jgi:hypothetical protein
MASSVDDAHAMMRQRTYDAVLVDVRSGAWQELVGVSTDLGHETIVVGPPDFELARRAYACRASRYMLPTEVCGIATSLEWHTPQRVVSDHVLDEIRGVIAAGGTFHEMTAAIERTLLDDASKRTRSGRQLSAHLGVSRAFLHKRGIRPKK